MRTKITELLQIEYPIFQGGMAWVAEHKLAAAVSNAGGLGIIGAASAPPEVVREEIRKCKELTDKPFGVNIMLLNPNAEDVEITEATRFKEDLEVDSLDLFELVMAFEEEYGVSIPSEELENMATVGDVIRYIQEQA